MEKFLLNLFFIFLVKSIPGFCPLSRLCFSGCTLRPGTHWGTSICCKYFVKDFPYIKWYNKIKFVFQPSKPHMGWNRTLQAMSMKPICPQLSNTIYDETSDELLARPAEMSEDCLYLNIWVSEVRVHNFF